MNLSDLLSGGNTNKVLDTAGQIDRAFTQFLADVNAIDVLTKGTTLDWKKLPMPQYSVLLTAASTLNEAYGILDEATPRMARFLRATYAQFCAVSIEVVETCNGYRDNIEGFHSAFRDRNIALDNNYHAHADGLNKPGIDAVLADRAKHEAEKKAKVAKADA